jgi:histone deacetylase complex regulatory component SIN3
MQEQNKKLRSKYGGHPLRAYDLGETSVKVTPSYRTYPSDYVLEKSSGSGGDTENDLLNFECFCIAQDWAVEHSGEKYFRRLEEYDGIKARCNLHEEILARVEDEMHEVDMAIERNASVMRALEPVADEATQLREQEENDGQPIGRLQYKLRSRALNSIHIGAIARIYGESGEEVLQHLLRNPLVVAPIVFNRLKEKNEEWRKVKTEMKKEWKKTIAEHIGGILDAKTYSYKREIEKVFSKDRLVEDCVKAKFFAKQPSKVKRHPSTNMILPDFHMFNSDSELGLFQPHISVLVSKSMPHEQANSLLNAYFSRDVKDSSDLVSFTKVWSEFISSWFGLPSQESLVETDGAVSSTVTLTPGRKVRTSVGVGHILSLADHNRYLVKFSFGVGYVVRSAVVHVFDENNADMDTGAEDNATDVTQLMSDNIQILFGTEKMYLFMRLYILLVTMLYQAKSIADSKGVDIFTELVSFLKELLQGKMTPKAFEDYCIKTFVNDAYNFVAIPPLVEKLADALVKMVKEDCLESLYQCSQLKLKVSVQR